ncbi:DUF3592 domain-containing protein [Parapedobacter deserti]|uniref:DUF3592 domain-containing protein n=1 Tax=Parapedobacter deserti TaxID=1912957 RepID=A0ABV7JHW8_9SPHI
MEYKSLICFIAGVAFLLFYVIRYSKRRKIQHYGTATKGRVVEIVSESRAGRGIFYYPIIRFTLADGEHVRYKYSDGSMPAAYRKGDEVTVYYQSDRPEDFIVEGQQRTDILFLLLGLVLIGGGIYFQYTPAG